MAKTMGVSSITDTIYYGNQKDGMWIGEKEDVTKMAIKAVFEWCMNKLKAQGDDADAFQIRFSDVPYVLEMRKEEKGGADNE